MSWSLEFMKSKNNPLQTELKELYKQMVILISSLGSQVNRVI